LEAKLSRLPQEERDAAMDYYEEYFEEAGIENEARALAELGSPSHIAKQIMADFVVKEAEVKPMKPKQSLQAMWIVILAIFASPIAFPIAIALAAVVFAAVVTVASLLFAGLVTAVAFTGSAILTAVVGFFALFIHPATGVFMIGSSLVLIGISLLMSMLMYVAIGKSVPAMTRGVIGLFNKVKGGRQAC
ncbi:MAG: DUF1700 domain-containing protein, partial [Niameybacter sp.]